MATPIIVPRLGWNMEQGVFVGWLKADGEVIRAGEALFTLESEKATEDIEAFDAGVLHIPADGPHKGAVVAVGAIIGFVLEPGEPIPALNPLAVARQSKMPSVVPASAKRIAAQSPMRDRPTSSPRARRTAAKLGIDWTSATGTGRTGRIRECDILALAETPESLPASPARSIRRTVAESVMTSHRSTAPVTLMTTIDATNLVNLRARWKAAPERSGGIAPTITDLFVKLAAVALQKHPVFNSRWEDQQIVTQAGIHIGIAVDTEAGLLVPVVREVTRLSLGELAIRSRDLVERARHYKLSASEMQGGTFTVTSLGSFGIDAFTPIIHYPECAILGVGRIRRCPSVVDDQVVIRDQVTLSFTFDHRIADGVPAARFLQTLRAAVESPGDAL